jgi:hypothetical protein
VTTPRPIRSALAVLLCLAGACAAEPATGGAGAGPGEGGLFPWRVSLEGDGPPLTAQPGGTWGFDFALTVDLRHHEPEMGRFRRLVVAVYGERRHDERGRYRSSGSDLVLSSRFTTAGVPIAGAPMWPGLRLLHGRNGSPFEGLVTFDLPADGDLAAVHAFRGRMEVAVPADVPRGWWHPRMTLLVEVEGVAAPVFLGMFYRERQVPPPPGLPLVEIGPAAPPRLPLVAFQEPRLWGQVGTLPEELEGEVALVALSRFPTDLILPPGRYPVGPGLPTLSPINAVPEIYAIDDNLALVLDPELVARIEVTSCSVEGPAGPAECLRGAQYRPADAIENEFWAGESYGVDLTRTGTYRVRLTALVTDPQGRRFEGGGTYRVHSALPLTFSTSCKPGTSFLVGNAYPPKVNVNPPVRAEVEVDVEYWPQSDPARRRVWRASGASNRLGHFTPSVPPIVFDEPGEYRSEVRATYRDRNGRLWMGRQASSGVIAPEEPAIRLRPAGNREAIADGAQHGERFHAGRGLLLLNRAPVKTAPLPAPPLAPADTLFVAVQPDALTLDTRFSVDVRDARLAERLVAAGTVRSVVLPRTYQPPGRAWTYVEDAVLAATANAPRAGLDWKTPRKGQLTDLPVGPVARGPLDPLAFPDELLVDAWVTFGAVRPGLSALVGVTQAAAWGSGWQLSPNGFGFQLNAGKNGDLPGEVYRVQAGVVLQDQETGRRHYDVYAASVVMVADSLPVSAVLPPGARPLLSPGGADQYLFLATDGFGFLERGETLDFGGMVFPNVRADLDWTVTSPSGATMVARGRADRRGIVAGRPSFPADEVGVWSVRARARHGDLEGGIPGAPDGAYWACVVPPDGPRWLQTDLLPVTRIAAGGTARVPLRWPAELGDVTLHYAAVTPGMVLEHGVVRPTDAGWTYEFTPAEAVIRAPNFDVRELSSGRPALADIAVFFFCLSGRVGDRPVADGLSVALRGDALLNAEGL